MSSQGLNNEYAKIEASGAGNVNDTSAADASDENHQRGEGEKEASGELTRISSSLKEHLHQSVELDQMIMWETEVLKEKLPLHDGEDGEKEPNSRRQSLEAKADRLLRSLEPCSSEKRELLSELPN
jgi:hypothetical protein